MPLWGYFLLGFLILALVLLTFRRNAPVTHPAPTDYGEDFRQVLEEVPPGIEEIGDALREGEEQALARAASSARSRIHASISNLDRLGLPEALGESERAVLEELRTTLRQAMEAYEWAARIAETTDLIDNRGLRRAYDSLVASGDELCAQARFQLVALEPAATET